MRHAKWRWMGPDAAIRVFPRGTRAFAVNLALHRSSPLPSNSVSVSVNGVPAATVEIVRGTNRRIEVPRPAGPGPLEIGFRSARSFIPANADSGADARRLAVQLLAVERIAR